MGLYDSTSPLLPYNAIAAGVIPPDVYGIGINYYANRVPLQRRLKHLPVGASQFKLTNDNFRPRSVNLSSSYSTTGTTLAFSDATSFDVGDVLLVDNELFVVTATHATTPTVSFAQYGTTNANHSSGTPAYLITNARTGAAINISGLSRIPVTVTQTTQTIEHAYSVGGSLASSANYVSGEGNPVDRDRMLAMQHCLDDMESAMYGASQYTIANRVDYASSSGALAVQLGLLSLIVTNKVTSPVNAAAYKPSDLARDVFQSCYQQGGNPSLMVVSTDWIQGFMTWGNAVQRMEPGETDFGTPITTFRLPFLNDIEAIPAPLLRAGTAIVLSEAECRIRMKRELFEKARGSRGDAIEGDFIMEGAIELDNEAHHAYVTNVAGWSAS